MKLQKVLNCSTFGKFSGLINLWGEYSSTSSNEIPFITLSLENVANDSFSVTQKPLFMIKTNFRNSFVGGYSYTTRDYRPERTKNRRKQKKYFKIICFSVASLILLFFLCKILFYKSLANTILRKLGIIWSDEMECEIMRNKVLKPLLTKLKHLQEEINQDQDFQLKEDFITSSINKIERLIELGDNTNKIEHEIIGLFENKVQILLATDDYFEVVYKKKLDKKLRNGISKLKKMNLKKTISSKKLENLENEVRFVFLLSVLCGSDYSGFVTEKDEYYKSEMEKIFELRRIFEKERKENEEINSRERNNFDFSQYELNKNEILKYGRYLKYNLLRCQDSKRRLNLKKYQKCFGKIVKESLLFFELMKRKDLNLKTSGMYLTLLDSLLGRSQRHPICSCISLFFMNFVEDYADKFFWIGRKLRIRRKKE